MFMIFRLVDANEVDLLHSDNLIVRLNVRNCTLKRVFIDPAIDVSILYKEAFLKIGFLLLMLNPSMLSSCLSTTIM